MDDCRTKKVEVIIQENGIIRIQPSGYIIGRIDGSLAFCDPIINNGASALSSSQQDVERLRDRYKERACCDPENEWGHTEECLRNQLTATQQDVDRLNRVLRIRDGFSNTELSMEVDRLRTALQAAEQERDDLVSELAWNASMSVEQCDLARVAERDNRLIKLDSILTEIEKIISDQNYKPSDFMESFVVVRAVLDMRDAREATQKKLRKVEEIAKEITDEFCNLCRAINPQHSECTSCQDIEAWKSALKER